MQLVLDVHNYKVCVMNTDCLYIIFSAGNVEELTGFRLRLVDLDGHIIQRPVNITNIEFTVTGRLEVLYSGHWGTVCSEGFTDTSRQVACKQLGYMRCVVY